MYHLIITISTVVPKKLAPNARIAFIFSNNIR